MPGGASGQPTTGVTAKLQHFLRECDGHQVRFVAPLRSWYVWNRCLIHLVSAPTWPSVSCDNCRDGRTDLGTRSVHETNRAPEFNERNEPGSHHFVDGSRMLSDDYSQFRLTEKPAVNV